MAQLASFDLRLIKNETLVEDLRHWLDQDQFAVREYSSDLQRLGALRQQVQEALTQGIEETSRRVDVLKEYAKSLELFEQQGFPSASNPGISLIIEWVSSTGEIESHDNLTWERANIIWNIAAVEAFQASKHPLNSKNAWKDAKTHMERAATLVHFLHIHLVPPLQLPDFSELSETSLSCLDAYLAADCQRAAYKFMQSNDRPPHLMCAKLAAATLPLYKQSQQRGKGGGWKDAMGAWGAYMAAISQYHQAMVHQQKNEDEMELARLEAAIKYAYIADDSANRVRDAARVLLVELQSLLSTMQERRTTLWEKLGQDIKVTSPSELSPIPPQVATTISNDISLLIPDVREPYFKNVADPESREKAEAVKARLQEWASSLAAEADELTELGRQVLVTLNLPHSLTAHFQSQQGGGLPLHLWQRIDVMQKRDTFATMQRDIFNTREASRSARFLLEKAEQQLNEDLEVDNLFRRQYEDFQGFDVERMQASFRQTLDNYKKLLTSAEIGDKAVLERLETLSSEPKFKLLNCRKTQLDRLIPKQKGKDIDMTKLNDLLDRLSSLFHQRESLVESLEVGLNDIQFWEECQRTGRNEGRDSLPGTLQNTIIPSIEEAGNTLRENLDSQHDLLEAIIRENEAFLSLREQSQGTASGDRCICMIEEATDELDQLKKHLAEGKAFYDVILPKLRTLQEQVDEVSHRLLNDRREFEETNTRNRQVAARSVAVGIPQQRSQSGSSGLVGRAAQLPFVDDEKVASLVGMDFDAEQATEALRRHNNNIEEALNDLLSR